MRASRRKPAIRWATFVAVLALSAAACDGGQAESTTTRATEIVATTQLAPTATQPVLEPMPCPDAFCVKYHIHPDASWNDGTPVTANDFAFTFDTIMNDQLNIASREGYNKMTGYEVVDDKTFLAIFGQIYAPWQSLFNPILPRHELEDKPFDTYWDDTITVSSGPFQVEEWVKGERVTLVRNPNYWSDVDPASGLPLGDVQQIDFVFIEDSQTMVKALRDREVDMINPQAQATLAEEISAIDGASFEAPLGPTWEHIDFNHSDPLLSQKFIRQAIAQGIDREGIVEAIVRPINANAEPLGNSVWLNTLAAYEDHFNNVYPYDPVAAEAYLTDNGCTKGDDGIYECDGRRLSFRWTTFAGLEDRELHFELAQADLAGIGIEVVATFSPASVILRDEEYFFGDADVWQIFNFAWVGGPDPSALNTLYYCEGDAPTGFGGLNNLQYCNDEVDALIRTTDAIADPAERAAVYNEADALWLAEIPLIPLYQKPQQLLGWYDDIQNVSANATTAGPLWNVASWVAGKDLVIFGSDQELESFNTLEPVGNLFAGTKIVTAVLEGAYVLTPDFRYVPQLITSAETIVPAG